MASSGGKKKVMLAIDESEFSRNAVEWTLDNLRDSIQQPLVIFTVQPISNLSHIPAASYGSPLNYAAPELIRSAQEHQRKLSLALLERAKEICASKGVDAEVITELGEPKEVICEEVDKHKIGLLIMGSHGRGAFQRAFLGSVSNYCVNHAKCPVLIVKGPGPPA